MEKKIQYCIYETLSNGSWKYIKLSFDNWSDACDYCESLNHFSDSIHRYVVRKLNKSDNPNIVSPFIFQIWI